MVHINQLSKIAVGTYRMHNDQHLESLRHAIKGGINLVDTASNYENGESEKMIGKLSKKEKESIFIISKVGYVQGSNFSIFENVAHRDNLRSLKISSSFIYCISPEYIKLQFQESLKRLAIDTLDCLLIHNPEYYLQHNPDSKDRLYSDLRHAFDELEIMRTNNLIRFYGISSNSILDPSESKGINFQELILFLRDSNKYGGFKFIQFPYNLCESSAKDKNYNGKSLIQLAQENDIITLSNRPLNAISKEGFVRLVDFKDKNSTSKERDTKDELAFNSLVTLLNKKLTKLNSSADLFSYQPMVILQKYRKTFGNYEAVKTFYLEQLVPFLRAIYNGDFPRIVEEYIEILISMSKEYTYLLMKNRSEKIRKEKFGIEDNLTPFSVKSCQSYLSDGIDHVIMGLRKKSYFDEINPLIR